MQHAFVRHSWPQNGYYTLPEELYKENSPVIQPESPQGPLNSYSRMEDLRCFTRRINGKLDGESMMVRVSDCRPVFMGNL